jgi:hypothetical protein
MEELKSMGTSQTDKQKCRQPSLRTILFRGQLFENVIIDRLFVIRTLFLALDT